MRRFFLTIGSLLLMSEAMAFSVSDGPVIIITNPAGPPVNIPPIMPKQIVADDITAEYHNGVLVLMFNADLGDADIVVSNLATGDSWSDSFSGYGSTSIILSGDSGYYTIDITTDYGTYYGEFEL